MAIDITKLAPVKGEGMAPRSVHRERTEQPNPFLDNGWLKESYDTNTDYQVTVDGTWEESKVLKGPRKGEPMERLTGEAADVTLMLRNAANRLGIGVSIQYSIPTYKSGKNKGEEIAGKVTVHYLGKERKRPRKTGAQPAVPQADTDTAAEQPAA